MTSNSEQRTGRKHRKLPERRKNIFPKEFAENTDLF